MTIYDENPSQPPFRKGVKEEATALRASAAGIAPPPESLLTPADSVWPGIASPASGAEASGPTANPWIDSNGWLLRLAQIRAPQKTVWLTFTPPGAPRVVLPGQVDQEERQRPEGERQLGPEEGRRAGVVGDQ